MPKKSKQKKTHAEQLEELAEKLHAKKKNLGPEGEPAGLWSLCGIGPEGSYINLDGTAEINSIKNFWTEAARLITNESLEYIFKNQDEFHDLLFRAILLLHYQSEKHSIEYINKQLKSVLKEIRAIVYKTQENYETQGDAFIALGKLVENIEKDFLKIERVNPFYKTMLQNELKDKTMRAEKARKNQKKTDAFREMESMLTYDQGILKKISEKDFIAKIKSGVYPGLTERQKQIYKGMAAGKSQKELAENLKISTRTVKRDKREIINVIKNVLEN
jgi:DNA-binding CsgD family transcriptional regulator